MSKEGHVWARMGAVECSGVGGDGHTQKRGKEMYRWLYTGMESHAWPGKFPQNTCCDEGGKEGRG